MIAGGRGLTPEATMQAMSRYASVPATDFGWLATIASNRVTEQRDTVTIDDLGDGQPFLLLHGGGGLNTVASFAELLASTHRSRAIYPTHPRFGGTPRPAALHTVRGGSAELHVALLDHLDLSDVTEVGNCLGGWVAADVGRLMGLDAPRRRASRRRAEVQAPD